MRAIKHIFYHTTLCFILLFETNCTRNLLLNPSASNGAIISPRKTSKGNPWIFGHAESISQNGAYLPVKLAYVSAGNQGTKSEENGNYSLMVNPGRYDVSIRCVGYIPILVRGVRVSESDSVRIDFRLVADTVKL